MRLIACYIFQHKLNILMIYYCISINKEVFVKHAMITLLLLTTGTLQIRPVA